VRAQPDCLTFRDTQGRCLSITRCRPLRALGGRGNFRLDRLLQRSICGFSGFLPKVCCPIRNRGGKPKPTTPKPTQKPKTKPTTTTTTTTESGGLIVINPITNRPVVTTTTEKIQITTELTTTTRKPFNPGSGPVTLIPPRPDSGNDKPLTGEGLPSDCGFSNASHTRIVGGSESEIGKLKNK